ncbi:DNA-binding transcriptional regulator, XRE-family HTH domain [Chitinophaga sp. YR573]|uniref:helix-turn-helix domain-containing protein n=1 Tax=Chitinophaga sp. YR573 TaxID=1881040 RepID=UPI0008AFDADF|nr:helix-turn-helix transcriptional regulator [Chitinophaga sp. YR573]SEW02299.1 DNA-binding transcriptional regulator, XRE-family HTH domain [Chitinophaga sp. YR573]
MNFFAQNIQLLRKEKGLTQDQMTAAIGVKRNTWSNYETKVSEPDIEKIIAISNYFDIAIDDLMTKDLTEHVQETALKGYSQKVDKSTAKSTGSCTDTNLKISEIPISQLLETKDQLIRSLQATIDAQNSLILIHNQQIMTILEENARLKRAIPDISEDMESNTRGGSQAKTA